MCSVLYLCLRWILSYGSNLTQGHDLHVALLCADLSAACKEDELCLSALGGESGCQALLWRSKSTSYLVVICSYKLAVRKNNFAF